MDIGVIAGQVVGALIATFLLRSIFRWALRRWMDRYALAITSNITALAVASGVGGIGMANGGPPVFLSALLVYAVPQILWLTIDCLIVWWGRPRD